MRSRASLDSLPPVRMLDVIRQTGEADRASGRPPQVITLENPEEVAYYEGYFGKAPPIPEPEPEYVPQSRSSKVAPKQQRSIAKWFVRAVFVFAFMYLLLDALNFPHPWGAFVALIVAVIPASD